MFAARGFEQTTIRAVAADAGVDASMVVRYFQSRAGALHRRYQHRPAGP
jgi:AcrR family transcriptional regulator